MLKSIASVLNTEITSWTTVLLFPSFLVLASLAKRFVRALCYPGTKMAWKNLKLFVRFFTLARYLVSWASFVVYSPVILLVTNCESLFSLRFYAPISCVKFIPVMSASYSAWLLLALNSNLRDCSISRSPGPSKTISASLPLKLEDPYTERSHTWGTISSTGDVSSTKFTKTWDLRLPLGMNLMSSSESSIDQAIIRPTRSDLLNTCLTG